MFCGIFVEYIYKVEILFSTSAQVKYQSPHALDITQTNYTHAKHIKIKIELKPTTN